MRAPFTAHLLAAAIFTSAAFGVPSAPIPDDPRYCGQVVRDPDGRIHRSTAVLNAFKRRYPCPVTGRSTGACPGWAINHTIPLACGGCDVVWNLDWMPNSIKSCANDACRDRWEMRVYCHAKVM